MKSIVGLTPWFSVFTFALLANGVEPTSAEAGSPHAAAAQVDRIIETEIAEKGSKPAPLVNDADFLRRITLDLAGRIPTPDEIRSFEADRSSEKRTLVAERLLANRDFSNNWAAYWRDVVFSRATDQRAVPFQIVFERWLADQFAAETSWADITRDILTATGDVRENGATGLLMAHQGDPEELAGEASRIFLGIQIQCANCHDHPSDAWSREQFHELAAYFPRVRVQPRLNQMPRTFEVVSVNRARNNGNQIFQNPQVLFRFLDRNRDGRITQAEAERSERFAPIFDRLVGIIDTDDDGALTAEELKNAPMPQNRNNDIEHFMSDLNDPLVKGTPMQPVFFLTEEGPRSGLADVDRRHELADAITDPDNEWFAKSFVNRIWTELFGTGFYAPVDDIGPLRIARHEEALNLLAVGFTESNYNVKWLFRAIVNTEAYQRQLQASTGNVNDAVEFACATPTRLRADQLYESLTALSGTTGQFQNRRAAFMGPRNSAKTRFAETFGFDPSTPQEDVQNTIPQALFMMNSETIDGLVSARGNTPLARLLRTYEDDERVLRELYLMTLSRQPTDAEIQICQDHFLQVQDRTETLEDIFWCLLNSSEFLTKR